MLRLLLLLGWLAAGCSLVPDGAYDERFDLDGDGVPWPDDCDDDDDAVSTLTTFHADADGDEYGDAAVQQQACHQPDGYVQDATDCDDDDETAFPGGVEVCDGADNDCNDDEDDVADPPVWTIDLDDDGYGRDGTEVAQCDAPSALYAPAGGDCDDDDPLVSPGTPETCNGFDDDCDDAIDDDDTVVVGAPTWYVDGDSDDFGDDATALAACIGPEGRVDVGGDCADGNPAVHPGALEDDCEDPTDYNCDGFAGGDDADDDGFSACTECDDGNALVHPGADELCNGDDDDCDGTADDEAIDADPWYADQDGDLYGDGPVVMACLAPDAHVAVDGDCDDGDPAVHPGATEVCNDLDDDCDTDVDDDDGDLTGAPTWYADTDGDGWGATAQTACVQPPQTTTVPGDCGPTNPDVHPFAAETDCDDPVDYNCDGSVGHADADSDTHEACADCQDAVASIHPGAAETCNDLDDDCDGVPDDNPTGAPTWYLDDDGDGFGDPLVSQAACDAPADHVADGTDCDDTSALINPGAGNCGQIEVDVGDGFLLAGVSGTRFGASVAGGDADGDAVLDVVVGAPLTGPSSRGTAWLLKGPFNADRTVPGGTTAQYDGENQSDQAGGTMAVLPVTGELWGAEVIIGAPTAGPGGSARGGVYVVHGNATGAVGLGNATAERSADQSGDLAATSLALLRDVNGNGVGEILVGAPGANDIGAAYVLRPPLTGNASLGTAAAVLGGETLLDEAGAAVCDAGDLAGTGAPWIAVGAPGRDAVASNAGVVYIVPGGVAGAVSLSTASAVLRGTIASEGAGRGLAALPDVDGDGDGELLVGAPGVAGGAVYLVKGPLSGTVALSGAHAVLEGLSGDGVGASLTTADVTGDGLDDVVIGAPGADGGLGAVYVWPSPVAAGTQTLGSAPYRVTGGGGSLGASVANAGDLDGDGRDDLIVGDPDSAAAWIVPGSLFTF